LVYSGTRAFLRGGNWNNGGNAGVLNLNLNNAPSNTNTNIGFRVSRDNKNGPISAKLRFSRSVPLISDQVTSLSLSLDEQDKELRFGRAVKSRTAFYVIY